MSEIILIPTPNWFISRPVDVSKTDDTIAFSVISSILFTDSTIENYKFTLKEAHTKRILGLSYYKGYEYTNYKNFNLLASCSEDLEVKIWNTESKTLITQHKLHQNTPTCIDWLEFNESNSEKPPNEPTLVSCDIKGNIFKWGLTSNTHTRYFPENKPVTQLKSCPNKYLIAVGYKQGTIVLLDIKSDQMKILHKLKNHEDTINCLSWCPLIISDETNVLTSKLNSESSSNANKDLESILNISDSSMLLCSSSEDKTVRIWCALKGIQLKCFKAPGSTSQTQSSRGKQSEKQQGSKITFTPLCWPHPQYILSASYKGELTFLDLINDNNREIIPSEKFSSVRWNSFSASNAEKAHKKIIYDISYCQNRIVTLSLDRLINTWNLKTFKQEGSILTINGFVYSTVSSPIDPISVGDGTIKLFNEKQPRRITKIFSNNIKSEVTQVSWHPTKESIIAFGTKDGKVGIADIMSNNKSAQYIFTGYNQSVYSLLWSTPILTHLNDIESSSIKTFTSSYALYSVADGKIMQHSIKFLGGQAADGLLVNSNDKAINFYDEIKSLEHNNLNSNEEEKVTGNLDVGVTELAIFQSKKNCESNYAELYFIIGKFDGSMELYAKKSSSNNKFSISKLCTFFNHQKLMTCIKWSKVENELSDRVNLIASGSNDFSVIIVDFDSIIDEIEKKNKEKTLNCNFKFFGKFKHKLVGHRERITGLSWARNSEKGNILASCSYDTTVQIWQADEGIPLANYRGHSDKLLTCMFSNIDSNIVFSGGEDYTLHRWRIDEQIHSIPPDECSILIGKKKNKFIKRMHKKQEVLETNAIKKQEEITATNLGSIETNELKLVEDLKLENESEQESEIKLNDKAEGEELDISIQTHRVNKPNKSTLGTKELKSLFSLSSLGAKSLKSKIQDCLYLFELLFEKNEELKVSILKGEPIIDLMNFELNKDFLALSPFCSRYTTLKLLSYEQIELIRLNSDKWWIFEIWRGNLAKIFHEFCEGNNLNDFIFNLYQISISSNGNILTFLNEYIEQLSKSPTSNQDMIHKSVMYSLAAYDVNRAIEIYMTHNYFAYALVLAQIRLAPNDPVLKRVLGKYGKYASQIGDYETAVLCFLRIADFENAFKTLNRRNFKNDEEAENLAKVLMKNITYFLN